MIYTSIIGEIDKPREDIKVFTAYNRFKEPRMNAKIYKVLSHLYDHDEYSIWIDGNAFLKQPMEEYIKLLGGSDIAVFRNPYRNCLYKEAEECSRIGSDDSEVIRKQVERYRKAGFPEDDGLPWCGLIIRRHTDQIKRLNERWWAEICRGSLRDQISFPYVFKDVVKYLPKLPPSNNEYFERITHLK